MDASGDKPDEVRKYWELKFLRSNESPAGLKGLEGELLRAALKLHVPMSLIFKRGWMDLSIT